MKFYDWAYRCNVPAAAILEMQNILQTNGTPYDVAFVGKSEAFAQSQVILEASQKGVRLFRNNVGALPDKNGRPVRYGLANHNADINDLIKSSDLIGIRPITIGPAHVGRVLGQFVSREIKEPGWHYKGDEHEEAQLRWLNMINALGGDAAFATGVGTL